MNNISENLFQSIDTIISQRLNEVQFDITVTGEVVDSSEAERGIYRVKSDNIEFSATGEPSRYVNGAQVYIIIPKGDYNNDKIIVGVVAKDVIAPLRYLRPMDYIIPFEKVNLSNMNNFKETVAWNWKYLCLSTNINGDPSSNYGLELWINNKMISRFDSTEFFGDPYNPMGMNQQKLFKVNEPIISIEIRAYGDTKAKFNDIVIAAGTPQADETEPERLVIARVDVPSVQVAANDEVKIQAYHVHKDSTGLYVAEKVPVSWYRYRDGTYNFGAGAGWGQIQGEPHSQLTAPSLSEPLWTIGWSKQDDDTITTYQLDKFPVEKAESIKAILGNLESNTLTLTSEQGQVQIDEDGNAIDFASRELIVTINGKRNPIYNVYGMDNYIISNPGKQTLEVKFADGTSAEGIEFEYIYPSSEDSMIIPEKVGESEEEKVINSFNLRNTYFPTYDSNTITVKTNVNGYVYKGTITPTFGYQDNNGTQYRFNATKNVSNKVGYAYTQLNIEVTLQDKNGNYFNMRDIVNAGQLEISIWSAKDCYRFPSFENAIWTVKESDPTCAIWQCEGFNSYQYGILEIRLKNWGSNNLSTYVIINSIDFVVLDNHGSSFPILNGPNRIVYSADGMSANYDTREYSLETLYPEYGSFTELSLSENQVASLENQRLKINYPAPLQKNNIVLSAIRYNGTPCHFPILCITNTYENELLNSWSGELKINGEDNYILSSLVGAGSKHEDNSFSGVLMGKVGNSNSSQYGIYGYNTGVQRFKLGVDGSFLLKGNDNKHITLSADGELTANLGEIEMTATSAKINIDDLFILNTEAENGDILFKVGNNSGYLSFTKGGDFYIKSKGVEIDSTGISWEAGATPTQTVYCDILLSKPSNGTLYNEQNFPPTGSGVWHRVLSTGDKYASYTYDGGNTWSEVAQIVGEKGVSFSGIVEKYYATNNASETPTHTSVTWYDTPLSAQFSENKKFLWNYEIVSTDDGKSSPTNPEIISVWGVDGNPGDVPSNFVSYYATNSSGSQAPDKQPFLVNDNTAIGTQSGSSWSTNGNNAGGQGTYLWEIMFTQMKKSDGSIYYIKTNPVCIGKNGSDGTNGVNGESLKIYYKVDSTTPDTPTDPSSTTGWFPTMPTPETGKRIYMTQRVSTNDSWSTPVPISALDGSTPTVELSTDSEWIINGEPTGVKAEGQDGATPTITISDDGLWVINGVTTDTKAEGEAGKDGASTEFIYWRNTDNNFNIPDSNEYIFEGGQNNYFILPIALKNQLEKDSVYIVSFDAKISSDDSDASLYQQPMTWDFWVNSSIGDETKLPQEFFTVTKNLKSYAFTVKTPSDDWVNQSSFRMFTFQADSDGYYCRYPVIIKNLKLLKRNAKPDMPEGNNPPGWTDSPSGIDEIYQVEYMSVRTKATGVETWGVWSNPVIWSSWGEKGQDGDGISYEYCLSKIETPPQYSNDWTDEPQGVSKAFPYEYVVQISIKNKTPIISQPKLWAKWSKDGEQGSKGDTSEAVRIFAITSSLSVPPQTPTKTTDEGILVAEGDGQYWYLDEKSPISALPFVFTSTGVRTVSSDGSTIIYDHSKWTTPELWSAYLSDAVDTKSYATFLKLTNNGTVTGIQQDPENGELYFNADFINTGTLTVSKNNESIFSADIKNETVEISGFTIGDITGSTNASMARTSLYYNLEKDNNYDKRYRIKENGYAAILSPKGYYYSSSDSPVLNGPNAKNWVLLLGKANSSRKVPFGITDDGTLYASNAHISGEITAKSGRLYDGIKIGEKGIGTISDYGGTSETDIGLKIAYDNDTYLALTNNNGGRIATLAAPVYITLSTSHGKLEGSWASDNVIQVTSDFRAKNAIAELPINYSTFFDNLNPVLYKYNDGTSNRYHTGFIAQDVQTALDVAGISSQDFAGLCIPENDEEYWTVRYGEFIALNTNEIQKLKKRVAELETELLNLKNQ